MRTKAGVERGLTRIADVQGELLAAGVAGDNLAFNLTWHDWLNFASRCGVSHVITNADLARENTRGAHFREKFPESGAMESSYFTFATQKGGILNVTREDVHFTIAKLGNTILPDSEPISLVEAADLSRSTSCRKPQKR